MESENENRRTIADQTFPSTETGEEQVPSPGQADELASTDPEDQVKTPTATIVSWGAATTKRYD